MDAGFTGQMNDEQDRIVPDVFAAIRSVREFRCGPPECASDSVTASPISCSAIRPLKSGRVRKITGTKLSWAIRSSSWPEHS